MLSVKYTSPPTTGTIPGTPTGPRENKDAPPSRAQPRRVEHGLGASISQDAVAWEAHRP